MLSEKKSIKQTPSLTKDRDCLFDNIRCILIFLTVFAHMFSPISKQAEAVQILYKFIFLFHMPAFILISGYFSKNADKCRKTAVSKFLIPYLVLNLISSVIYLYKHDLAWYKLNLFYPRWGMWFLLILFVSRFLLSDLLKVRFVLPLSFLFGILSGCFDALGERFGLGRLFAFLPFFMLGVYLTPEHIEKIRRIPKWIPLLFIFASFGFILFVHFNHKLDWTPYLNFSHGVLFMRNSYHSCNLTFTQGILARGFSYLFALSMTFSLIALMPRKSCYLSYIGRNTLPVYALHLFVLPYIKALKVFGGYGWDYAIFSAVIAIALTQLFSSKPVANAYNWVQNKIELLLFRSESD